MTTVFQSIWQETAETLAKFSKPKRISTAYTFENARFINPAMLYVSTHSEMPSRIIFSNVDKTDIYCWLRDEVKVPQHNIIKNTNYSDQSSEPSLRSAAVWLNGRILIYFSSHGDSVELYYNPRLTPIKKLDWLTDKIKTFPSKIIKRKAVEFILSSHGMLYYSPFELKCSSVNLNTHYNDDFINFSQTAVDHISRENEKGLFLLHGKPGTGKTTFLRYLASTIEKRVIYLSPEIAGNLSEPSLLALLTEAPNSILIIEDSEDLIADRNFTRSSAVSNLLNLCDGILSDLLSIQVICTFNTPLSNIDPALLRKGRLTASYEFKELSLDKARNLAKELKKPALPEREMTLADVYGLETEESVNEITKQKKVIGFY